MNKSLLLPARLFSFKMQLPGVNHLLGVCGKVWLADMCKASQPWEEYNMALWCCTERGLRRLSFSAPLLPCWEVLHESLCFLSSLFPISEIQVTMFTSPFCSILRSRDKSYEKARYYPWLEELHIIPLSSFSYFRAFLTLFPFPILHTSLVAAATLPSYGYMHIS